MLPSPPARACGVCGAPARPPFQAPPPELAPDLDLRPGEPTRSTLGRWLSTCRTCGATAPDLAALPPAARSTVDTSAYRAHQGPAAPFLRYAMLCDPAERPGVLLQAAWALDDAGSNDAGPDDAPEAAALRRQAAAGLARATTQDALCALDAWRRAGEMQPAAAQAARLLATPCLDETDRLVVAYQQQLIAARDTSRHLLSSALRPPAQRPHVTHGRAQSSARRTFWQRLAGR